MGMSYHPVEYVEALIHFLEATIPEEGKLSFIEVLKQRAL
jgi:hypothetical protein